MSWLPKKKTQLLMSERERARATNTVIYHIYYSLKKIKGKIVISHLHCSTDELKMNQPQAADARGISAGREEKRYIHKNNIGKKECSSQMTLCVTRCGWWFCCVEGRKNEMERKRKNPWAQACVSCCVFFSFILDNIVSVCLGDYCDLFYSSFNFERDDVDEQREKRKLSVEKQHALLLLLLFPLYGIIGFYELNWRWCSWYISAGICMFVLILNGSNFN